jgi:hypothetical protein
MPPRISWSKGYVRYVPIPHTNLYYASFISDGAKVTFQFRVDDGRVEDVRRDTTPSIQA